jgi:hypothetical protein
MGADTTTAHLLRRAIRAVMARQRTNGKELSARPSARFFSTNVGSFGWASVHRLPWPGAQIASDLLGRLCRIRKWWQHGQVTASLKIVGS